MCNRKCSHSNAMDDGLHVVRNIVILLLEAEVEEVEEEEPKRTLWHLSLIRECRVCVRTRMYIYIAPDDATTKLKKKGKEINKRNMHDMHDVKRLLSKTWQRHTRTQDRSQQHLRRLNMRRTRGAIFFFTSHTLDAVLLLLLPRSVVFFQLSRCHFVIGKIVFAEHCLCVCCALYAVCAHEDDTICLMVDDHDI